MELKELMLNSSMLKVEDHQQEELPYTFQLTPSKQNIPSALDTQDKKPKI